MKYFKDSEFLMGGKVVFDKMDLGFLEQLELLREKVGIPLIITSSYRSPEYNKSIKGAKNSMHLYGRAVDIAVREGQIRRKIINAALDLNLTVGVAGTFLHIDNRQIPIIFTY